jgi:N-acetylglucosaminyldiphosphoundecaprenol N-acetyl-beta-D-mannosaminyltransferase
VNKASFRLPGYGRSPFDAWQRNWIEWRRQCAAFLRRSADILAASFLFAVVSPVLLVLYLGRHRFHIGLTDRRYLGYRGQVFVSKGLELGTLSTSILARSGIAKFGLLWNLFKGDLTLVGPRPVRVGELDARTFAARARQDVTPGFFCLWWLRQKASIDYGTELEADLEYASSRTPRGDLGIGVRCMLASLQGQTASHFDPRPMILRIPVDNLNMVQALDTMERYMAGSEPRRIAFVNADCANIAHVRDEYRRCLRTADLVLPDGIGVKLAGRFLGSPIRQNVNGTDLFPRLCQRLSGTEHALFLLGGQPGVAADVAAWVAAHHPGVRVAGHRHGFFSAEEEESVLEEIRSSGATVLLVAFGAPRQDLWIADHLAGIPSVRVAMGVGGLFDFFAGRIPRAPQWVREIGCEWAFRLYQEPGRLWRRYFVGNAVFLIRVFSDATGLREYWQGGPKEFNIEEVPGPSEFGRGPSTVTAEVNGDESGDGHEERHHGPSSGS